MPHLRTDKEMNVTNLSTRWPPITGLSGYHTNHCKFPPSLCTIPLSGRSKNQYAHIRANRRAHSWDHSNATGRPKRVRVLELAGAGKTSLLRNITSASGKAPRLQVQITAIGCKLEAIELPRLTRSAMPRSGLARINNQKRPYADGVSFVKNAGTHEDEMQKALRALEARVFSLSDTSENPLMALVSRSDEKVYLDLALTQI
jgi:hypothetical protein